MLDRLPVTPPVSATASTAAVVRPVFNNTRQKPLPLGAGTIRGGVPPAPSSVSSLSIPPTILPSVPTILTQSLTSLTPIEESELSVRTATISNSIPSLPNLKKPGETYQLPTINKQKKIAWVESQIKKDQHEAVNPNYRTPFRSKEDACKRLLRYHVFDELDMSPWEMERADENFEIKSAIMISRYVFLPFEL